MYQVVQTTGPDGKNLLKLLPISKSSGSFVPIVQPSAMQNNSKANISSELHLTFKTQLATTTAPSSVKIPVFQSPNPGKIIITRTLDKQEGVRAGSEKESLVPNSAATIQSSCVSVDRLTLQNVAVTSSSNQSNTAYMVLNTKNLPATVKSPVLPSGHHIQIPADAEVKSIPASFLPPAVQQKILAAAAPNMSGGAESTKMPIVIYVSPVKTVKTVLPENLQAICPRSVTEVSKTLIVTPTQQEMSSSAETGTADWQQFQQTPMKWIVQESPQSSAPCLTPVKSSNNVASRILKALSGMKDAEVNSANTLPLCSSGAGGSQIKVTHIKENALVLYDGKVYLLTKRSSDLSAQADLKASSSSDASLKKETSKLIDSTKVTKITTKVLHLVVSKKKGMVFSWKDPNLGTNSNNSSPAGLRNDSKSALAALVTPGSTEQNSTVNQREVFPFTESISTPVTAVGVQENVWQDGKESHSPEAASAVLPQSKQECPFSEDCQKIQCGKMVSPRKVIRSSPQEKPHWKQYLKLRKQFGLYKEERVYLTRIPLRNSCEPPEEGIWSSNSLKKEDDSWSSSSLSVEITNQQQTCDKEEKTTGNLEEDLTKKRKIKSSPVSDSGKRRKTSIKSTTSPSPEHTSLSSDVNSVLPPPVLPQQSLSADFGMPPLGRDLEQDPYTQYSKITDSSAPVLVSCASPVEGSFRDDAFRLTPPDLDETVRDEKIKRLKQLLREREAALEEMRRKMQQS